MTYRPHIKRLLILFVIIPLLSLAAMAAWYGYTIHQARQQTPALIQQALAQQTHPLQAQDLNPQQLAMLLAVEDPLFMQHKGVDFQTPGAGMTTITQGLVKQIYFPAGFQPGIAKIRQTLIARYVLNEQVSKAQQLQLLLNLTYFGHENGKSVQGFAQAAQVYFHKDFAALSDDEFLALTAMLIGPNAYKPGTAAHTERMRRLHAYLKGELKPASLLDVEYSGKQQGSRAEEMLIKLLRLLTD
ncbi:transglycosylase domain-containing protein [Thiofilum flexile]|uniref:transglycosylase domain-containing protein n=1 Tax=Thiofilum flexile TaxID=125627 RepID=UPI00037A62D6|nr:transglycosylase domain-containing protein [Thiofilum flexile]